MYEEKENIEPEFLKRLNTNPFRTPEGYFDTLEDRIMEGIQHPKKKKTISAKIFRILKPTLGLAASIMMVYLLTNYLGSKDKINSNVPSTASLSMKDDSAFNFSMIDESTLVNAIFTDETSTVSDINPDDMLAYLSSGLNEVEIYSEIQN